MFRISRCGLSDHWVIIWLKFPSKKLRALNAVFSGVLLPRLAIRYSRLPRSAHLAREALAMPFSKCPIINAP